MQAGTDSHDPTPDIIWSTMLRQLERKPGSTAAGSSPRRRSVCRRRYGLYLVDRATSKTVRVNRYPEVFDVASCLVFSCALLPGRIQSDDADGALLSFGSNAHPRQVLARLDSVIATINGRLAATPWQLVLRAQVLH